MPYQKFLFFGRLVLLLLFIAAPVSATFLPAANAVPAPSDRPPVSLPAPMMEDGTVRIDGSNSMIAINRLLQQRYQEQYPDLKIEIEQHGTEAALKALQSGEIDLAAIGRSLTAAEKANGLVEIPVSQDKIAIIVGQENPFRGTLTLDQLAKIFRGEITNWSEVGGPDAQIRIIDRPQTSDTRLALAQYGLLEDLQRFSLKPSDIVQLETDDTAAVIQKLGTDGIGYAIVDQVRGQEQVRLIRIAVLQDILPDSRLYPYVFSRGYAYKATLDPALQSFIGFATAQPGQEAVTAAKGNEAKAVLAALAAAKATIASSPTPSTEIAQSAVEPAPVASKPPVTTVLETAKDDITETAETAKTGAVALVDETKSNLQETGQALKDTVTETTAAIGQKAEIAEAPEKALTEPIDQIKDRTVEAEKSVESARDAAEDKLAAVTADRQFNPPAAKVITPVLPGRIVTQPELNQQYFDSPDIELPESKIPIVVEKPAQVIEKSPETGAPVVVEKPTRIVERLDETQIESEPPAPIQVPVADASRESPTADRPDWFWWVLLPLLLVGWFFRWLNKRNARLRARKTSQTPVATPPIAEPPSAVVPAQPAEVMESPAIEPVAEPVADLSVTGEVIAPVGEPVVAPPAPEIAEAVEPDVVGTPAIVEPAAESGETPLIEIAEPEIAEPEIAETAQPVPPTIASTPQPSVAGVMTPVPQDDSDPTVERFQETFVGYLRGYLGKTLETATLQESYTALAYLVRDRLLKLNAPEAYLQQGGRLVAEIAAEYLPGPHLANNLINLGYLELMRQAMRGLGLNLDELIEQEEEPGLGKGGLGRLMVCYLDALSTAEIPAIGYGIRYEYGIFDQEIKDGWQVEIPDRWLRNGNPWELERPEAAVEVKIGGQTQAFMDEQGQYRARWVPAEVITGIPYDTPISGYRARIINPMRLWKAESDQLSKVLYPVDVESQGKALRLKQQFFLVSCALQDALRLHLLYGGRPDRLHERFALQINDTDPTLAVAELMRLLVDEHSLDWEQAWEVTQQTLAYTNHSLMPETLDDLWTVGVFAHLLPRHLEIIFEINNRFLETVQAKYPGDVDRLQRMSLIDEQGERYVRTTYLACVGSHAVNGVSRLHTQLLEQTILRDFYELYPEKFSNKTNGITPRRFLLLTNPRLANFITSEIGDGWITDLGQLRQLEGFAGDRRFRQEWRQIKQANKQDLAAYIQQQTGIQVDVNSLFDVHTMRLHEYMRKHLQVLHILTLYNRIKANPNQQITPRTFIFSGKAAPDYFTAKLIIKLIHSVAELVNADPDVQRWLKVVFLPDYNLKVAQRIYPAADVAEYISTAGTEACSTGNMIFAANGATIVGTLDGSNIELREAVGAENFFSFGLTAQDVVDLRSHGYSPLDYYTTNPDLKAALDLISSGALSHGDTELFKPLVNLLLHNDYYLLLADYQSFLDCQEQVSHAYRQPDQWVKKSILNTARIGRFSADRAIAEYSQEIWHVRSVGDRLRQITQPQSG